MDNDVNDDRRDEKGGKRGYQRSVRRWSAAAGVTQPAASVESFEGRKLKSSLFCRLVTPIIRRPLINTLLLN